MRELEFLPDWYPRLRLRRRLVRIQACMTLTLLGGLALWSVLAGNNLRQAEASVASLRDQLSCSEMQLKQLDELLALQKQWRHQDQIVARLGPPVDAARLLNTLDGAMPRGMALRELNLETQEQPRIAADLGAARAAHERDQMLDRRLKLRLRGVAPSDVDVANFLARLGAVSFFRDVSMTYARESADRGYLMREFEVTFALDLNNPAVGG